MLTYMFLFNSGIASGHMLPEINATEIKGPGSHENARHEKNFESKIARLADKFGLDADELTADLESHKTIKQILKKHGITKNQLREVMGNKRVHAR